MKTYVIMISRVFPATHPRKGEKTYFIEKILKPSDVKYSSEFPEKLHTIRANYELWTKRISEVQSGNAELSLRYWTGSPYNSRKDGSKQKEFLRLTKDHGVSIQSVVLNFRTLISEVDGSAFNQRIDQIGRNDGLLCFKDFKNWFEHYDMSKPMAIIHFTPFRY